MKLLRITSGSSPTQTSAADHLATGACDLLQFDWNPVEESENPVTFLEEWKKLHKYFFLDQRLRMITNAGSGGVLKCVEAMGQYLCEHGDPQVPITAVRGENILPRLPDLSAEGVRFKDLLTGEELPVDSERVLTAQVQIGAGPIATALDEESRIVVLGCYDPVAPFLAAGVHAWGIAWGEYETLGKLALAAMLSDEFQVPAELAETGVVLLKPHLSGEPDPVKLKEWLSKRPSSVMQWADVACDIASLELSADGLGGLQMIGIEASAPRRGWQVRFQIDIPGSQPKECWSEVPRELVNISVDTRAAYDWR